MKLDKFYTKPAIAEQCVSFLKEKLPLTGNETYLEPSAGDGSFLAYLPQFTAIDIKPEGSNIQAVDFFTYSTPADICIGNPPFGSRSAMAIKFFNHAAELEKLGAKIEIEKNSKQTELNALQTELQSAKSIIDKNVERGFNLFG